MNKKNRFILIIAAATVFNILVTTVCFFILVLLYNMILIPHIPAEKAFTGLPFLFILAVIITFAVYQRVLRIYLRKMEGFPPEKENSA
ncbi:MAG: leader peptide processing enzyme [Treponema sp.]|nr:leader peptide processing enzyme [Treponema sp.]